MPKNQEDIEELEIDSDMDEAIEKMRKSSHKMVQNMGSELGDLKLIRIQFSFFDEKTGLLVEPSIEHEKYGELKEGENKLEKLEKIEKCPNCGARFHNGNTEIMNDIDRGLCIECKECFATIYPNGDIID